MIKAILSERKNMFAPWELEWNINGKPYFDTFKNRKDALEYAEAMGFEIEERRCDNA